MKNTESNLFVILGNQLFDPKILKEYDCKIVFMAEDFGLCTYEKHHKLKIYLFLCAMREYRDELQLNGIEVHYLKLEQRKKDLPYLDSLKEFVMGNQIKKVNFFEIDIVLSLDLPSTIIKLFFSTFNKHVSKTSLIFSAAFNVQTAIQVFLFFFIYL